MIRKNNRPGDATELHKHVKEIDREFPALSSKKIKALSPEEIQQMFHELQVHQIELEMQNEELRQTQSDLEASRDLFFNFYDLSPVGYFTLNEQGLILEVNLTAADLLGVPKASLVGQPLTCYVFQEDQDIYYRHRKKLIGTNDPQKCELRMLKKDDSPIWVRIESNTVKAVDGNPVNRIVMSDITERKRAGEAIQDSENRFRAAFMGSPSAVCITTLQDGVWIDANQAELDMFGYTREEVIGKSALNTNLWADPTDRLRIVAALNRGEEVRKQDIQLRHKDGRLIFASISATALTLKGVAHILYVTEDVTERKIVDKAMKSALQEKEVLLREIHHRVKNNMQVVCSLLNLQATRSQSEQVRQALSESQQRVYAMAMIHEELYSGQNLSAIDFSEYLKRLINHLQGAYNNKTDIRITLESDKVEIDISQAVPCSLILNELITNAFKHAFPSGSQGKIHIKVYISNDREVVLELSDNGVGLPADQDLSNLSTLGLKLVQGLLKKQLKGSLDMTTESGTAFTLRWPLSDVRGKNA